MEHDFKILYSYRKKAEQDKHLQEKNSETEEEDKKCLRDECVEREEAYVCRNCGLGDNLYQPDMDWHNHAVMEREYTDTDRLNAIDSNLLQFLEKVDWTGSSTPRCVIQERLLPMKITSGYQSLNYAIALMCILGQDEEAQKKSSPFLPSSNVAWARSMKVLSPLPKQFVRCWLRKLLNTCI